MIAMNINPNSNTYESVMVGFSIRAMKAVILDKYKPGTDIISIDPNISEPHPLLFRLEIEQVGQYVNAVEDLRFCYQSIRDVYSILESSDRRQYAIYCYSIIINRALNCTAQNFVEINGQLVGLELFAYAVHNRQKPFGEFKGYDVADCDWVSAITDCDLHWTLIEQQGNLNSNHLFDNMSDATRFMLEADKLVQEHAPFHVWGVYKLA
jgi:hypothetical protein